MGKQSFVRLGIVRAATAAMLVSLVAACASDMSDPAPVVMKGAGPGTVGEASTGLAAAGERRIVVQTGQQLGRIAEAYHVPKRAIIAANHLQPPYKLAVGQKLVIPGGSAAAP